jgi:hypothetical protein
MVLSNEQSHLIVNTIYECRKLEYTDKIPDKFEHIMNVSNTPGQQRTSNLQTVVMTLRPNNQILS